MIRLYHISSWEGIPRNIGDVFTLHPGPQGAEGTGVYFSAKEPRPGAADAAYNGRLCAALVCIEVQSPKGWWRTKNSVCRKFGRPRTYHTQGKSLRCKVVAKEGWGKLICEWKWAEED